MIDRKSAFIPKNGWDGSVNSLSVAINNLSDIPEKAQLLEKLNELVLLASVEQTESVSLLYMICFDVLSGLATQVADSSEVLRKRLGLPLFVCFI